MEEGYDFSGALMRVVGFGLVELSARGLAHSKTLREVRRRKVQDVRPDVSLVRRPEGAGLGDGEGATRRSLSKKGKS